MTLKRERAGGTATLPRLDIPAEHEAIRQATPPDLKGLQYPTLPHVGHTSRSNHRSHGDDVNMGPVILLPAIGEPHPFPYVVSPDVRLTGSGKEELYLGAAQDQGFEDAALYFLMETKFSKEYFDEFFPSILLPEVKQIAKNTLHPEDANKKSSKSAGPPALAAAMAPDAADGIMRLDSEDNAEKDDDQPKDEFLEDAVIAPLLQEDCREVVWEMVDEKARSLPAWKVEEMNQKASQLTLSEPLRKAIARKACGRQATPEMEKQLAGAKLEKVLFEYQRIISKHKLTENFAMKVFQDEIISKSVEDRAIDDGFRNLEKDVEMHESEEKRRHSPRS